MKNKQKVWEIAFLQVRQRKKNKRKLRKFADRMVLAPASSFLSPVLATKAKPTQVDGENEIA